METPNYYEEKAKAAEPEKKRNQKRETTVTDDNKEGFADAIKGVMTDAGLAVVGGGLTSSILGRLSLPIGLLLTGYGHYKKNNALRILGVGIMASSSMTNRKNSNPKATVTENISERVKAFGEELKSKLCLDLLQNTAASQKENKTGDLKGTDSEQKLSAANEPAIEPQIPPADYFINTSVEPIKKEPVKPVEEIPQPDVRNAIDDELDYLASVKDRLL